MPSRSEGSERVSLLGPSLERRQRSPVAAAQAYPEHASVSSDVQGDTQSLSSLPPHRTGSIRSPSEFSAASRSSTKRRHSDAQGALNAERMGERSISGSKKANAGRRKRTISNHIVVKSKQGLQITRSRCYTLEEEEREPPPRYEDLELSAEFNDPTRARCESQEECNQQLLISWLSGAKLPHCYAQGRILIWDL